MSVLSSCDCCDLLGSILICVWQVQMQTHPSHGKCLLSLTKCGGVVGSPAARPVRGEGAAGSRWLEGLHGGSGDVCISVYNLHTVKFTQEVQFLGTLLYRQWESTKVFKQKSKVGSGLAFRNIFRKGEKRMGDPDVEPEAGPGAVAAALLRSLQM